MFYLKLQPGPQLRSWVRSLWYCRAPGGPRRRERVLPDGCIQIILNLSRDHLTGCGEDGRLTLRLPPAIVVGARARFGFVDTADMDELAGIVIEPGGFPGLFRERADLFFERATGLEAVWACEGLTERLCEAATPLGKLRTLERLLSGLLNRGARRSGPVDQALHLFAEEGLSVSECARSVGLCERRLSQVFRECVGMAPKMWCRIRRFQAAARGLRQGAHVRWAELALACGYYDQAHLANDFRAFSGVDPTTYTRLRGHWHNHLPVPNSDFSKTAGPRSCQNEPP